MANWFITAIHFFGEHSAWLLLGAAALMFTWILEAKKRKDKDEDGLPTKVKITPIIWIISVIGMVYGFFLIIGGVMTELIGASPSYLFRVNHGPLIDPAGDPSDPANRADIVNHFTVIIYVLTGIIMFFKPLKDIPWAAILSLTAATIVVILVMFSIPDQATNFIENYIAIQWAFVIIFVVVLAFVYIATKAFFDIIIGISKFFSHPVVAFIYAIFISIQAICLLAGYSIVMW
ncbi:MAG: hypothetical protein ACTSWN_01970 [Promethearchaeota archaeon]